MSNYLFDLIAEKGDSVSSGGNLTGFEDTTSINDSGLVAFIGKFGFPEDLLVGDGQLPIRNLSSNSSSTFRSGVEINNDNEVVAIDSSSGFSAIRLWSATFGSILKTLGIGAYPANSSNINFENILPFPRLNNNSLEDQVAFLADPKGGNIETALTTFEGTDTFGRRIYDEVILTNATVRPTIADDGTIVIKDLGENILLYDYQLNITDVIASNFKGFSTVGAAPAISNDSKVVAFYGNLTNPGADSSTVGLEPGEGIFVSIETATGRKIERIAGIAENGILDPGETHDDLNGDGIVDPGEDIGDIYSFASFERIGVNFNDTQEAGNVVYLALDDASNIGLFSSQFDLSTAGGTTETTVNPSLVAKAGQEANTVSANLSGNIQDIDIYDPINESGQIAFRVKTTTSEEAVVRANPVRKPILILPGIGGSIPQGSDPITNRSNYREWVRNRGVDPTTLEIDPFRKTYDDLIETLKRAGYQEGVDLFVANYDWRLNPGPIDGTIDGRIERSAAQLMDDTYEYAMDHLGYWLEQAEIGWKGQFTGLAPSEIPELDAVDIVTHSTGGLVAKSYIQSDAYGADYTDQSGNSASLPKINNFFMVGVPNRGSSLTWNSLNNNFFGGPGIRTAGAMIRSAFQKLRNGETITVSGDPNAEVAITPPTDGSEPDINTFIEQYIPTYRALLATYPFILESEENINNPNFLKAIEEINPSQRNNLLLDLNNGFDSVSGNVGDPNEFADKVERVEVIFGTNARDTDGDIATRDSVVFRDEPDFELETVLIGNEIVQVDLPQRTEVKLEIDRNRELVPEVPQGDWYKDQQNQASQIQFNIPDFIGDDSRNFPGDDTVPLLSAIGTFLDDTGNIVKEDKIKLRPFTLGANTNDAIDHTGIVSNIDVQKQILNTLGVSLDDSQISTDRLSTLSSTILEIGSRAYAFAASWIVSDPVELFIIDANGNRLGYSQATGAVTEIPDSIWLGDEEGIGYVPETIEGPVQLELTGLDEDYFVSIALETDNGPAGIELEGFLNAGEQIVVDVPLIPSVNSYQAFAEYGVIDNLTDDFQTIDLTNNYTNPVVFAQPLSFNGPSTAAVRLDNVTENSFDVQAQEANYLDGSHSAEQVSYFVIEAGTWQLPSGEILQVGTTNSDQLISDEWESVSFDQQFETIPAVFSQVQTKNDSDFVRTRQKSISTNGFQFGMEEEEANENSGHADETLGWFAIEEGQGTWGGNNYQVGTTGKNVTHSWSSIDFDPNFSQTPQFLASLSSYTGSDPAGLRYRNLNEDTVEIKIEEDTSFDAETNHFGENISYLALEGSGLLVAQPREVFAETGTISLTDAIETINLSNTYENPVVFVQPPSFNGSQPALVRLDNITNNSFDARIQVPDYLVNSGQGSHTAETMSYFVFEAGTWQLEDGTLLEVGTTISEDLVKRGAGFDTVDFDLEFGNEPIVISQVQTENGPSFVRTRQRNTSVSSFEVAMEEQESFENTGHYPETVGYLAIEPGLGETEGFTYYADNTGDTVTDDWSQTDFNGAFTQTPQLLAGINSYDDSDPAGLRADNLSATGVEFKVEEDQSFDNEREHATETVDFLTIAGSGSLSATPIDPFSANSEISTAEAINRRERLISQFEDSLFEVAMDT